MESNKKRVPINAEPSTHWRNQIDKRQYGSFIVMAYNFMPLFRHEFINSGKKQFHKRYDLISTTAYLGANCHKTIPALHNGNG